MQRKKIFIVSAILILTIGIISGIQIISKGEAEKMPSETVNEYVVSWIEASINKQKEACANIIGEWVLVDFCLPTSGAPAKDRAEDYLNTQVKISYADKKLVLEYQGNVYEMSYIKPLEPRYFIENGRYPTGLDDQIINQYACEICFHNQTRDVSIYVNEHKEAYLKIKAEVADLACFYLECSDALEKTEAVELSYFDGMVEYLIENCKLRQKYYYLSEPTLMSDVGTEHDIFIGKDIYVNQDENGIYVHTGDEKLYLTNVEEVMGLHVGYMLVTDTICRKNEKALLYTFSNEDYDVQIMAKSDGKNFVRVNYKVQGETCVYQCMTEEIYRIYADFFNGSLSAYTNEKKTDTTSIWDIMIPTGEPGNCYRTEYAFFDMNNDGIQECHIRSARYYEIYTIYDGELYLWGTQHPQTELLSNGDLLYTHIGGVNLHEDYTYIVLDDDGETLKEVSFGWGDDNSNSVMDAEDYFYFDKKENISMDEWQEKSEWYMFSGTDKITWILLQEEYQYN